MNLYVYHCALEARGAQESRYNTNMKINHSWIHFQDFNRFFSIFLMYNIYARASFMGTKYPKIVVYNKFI